MPKPSSFSRLVGTLGIVSLAILQLPSLARAQGCDIPSFNTRPFAPTTNVKDVPTALAAGTFYKHDGETRCGCDLAITVAGAKDVLVIRRGDDSGALVPTSEQPMIGIGTNPIGLVSGRFIPSRADALDDLVVLSGTASDRARVALFAPDTTGRYQQVGADVLVAAGPRSIVAGDFNGDKNLDVSVLSDTLAAQSLTVLFGDGKGGFAAESPAVLAIADPTAWSMAAGKFQGNTGPDDIAIATDAGGSVRVSIARRSAAAGFQFLGPLVVGAGGEAYLAAGTLGRRADRDEDLVVAFSDVKGGGHAALVRGGTQVARTADIAGIPRSARLEDLNGDGTDDLVVAVFTSADAVNPDGIVTIFRGAAAALIDFDSPLWKTPPSRILPRRLVTGRFGIDRATRVRHLGLAAVNAPALNTVSVYVGNGTGAFAAPSGFATAIDPNATLMIQGDFDAGANSDKVLDLAYLLQKDGDHVLTVLLGNGERTFRPITGSVTVGRSPLQMIAGRFDADALVDIAVVDANLADTQRRPRLQIWVGDGKGGFFRPPKVVSDFLLDAGETPVGIVTGQFKNVGAARPSDVAIVSRTAANTGSLKLFLNDGKGQFEIKSTPLVFKPAAVAASEKFRAGVAVHDVVIKREGSGRFAFLENRGDGEFVRIEEFDDPSGDADAAGQFVVGDVNADGLDDIVQLDTDRSIDVFSNAGAGRFAFVNVDALKSLTPAFDAASASFFLEKLPTGPPALLGFVKTTAGQAAIIAARGAAAGGFVNPRMDVLELPRAESLAFAPMPPRTLFHVDDISHAERTGVDALPASAFSGRFANLLHGNAHDDIGFLSRVGRITVGAGACPSDPRPHPGPLETCTPSDDDAVCHLPCPSAACTAAKASCDPLPVCQNPPCQLKQRTCRTRCPDNCVLTPRRAFCQTGAQGLYVVVFRNTCGG
jgi:hypothetical protein